MLTTLLDAALDATVVPGYTRIGSTLRRRWWDEIPPLDGRTALVTGATSGIGRAAAQQLAHLSARVVLLARDADRGRRTRDEIARATGSEDVGLVLGDLSSVASTRAAVEAVVATEPFLHVLVNNAGVLAPARRLSPDGLELTFATNVLGTFLLTEGLVELLAASAPARIITVSSGGMYTQRVDLGDLQTARGDFDGPAVYARTKRAQVLLTDAWARRLAPRGVVAHAMHPGWVDTPGVQTSLPRFHRALGPLLRSPAEGADTITWLAAAAEPGRTTGGFWHDRRRRAVHRLPTTRERPGDAERLHEACRRLAAERTPTSGSLHG
ncbi:MAG TPA: SDR family NAD(P)-dependent oxidoreductase [Baekduia sp.]|nr:SDR family NAD(P)-dependent oxidoreductase [Baekduia sp.]